VDEQEAYHITGQRISTTSSVAKILWEQERLPQIHRDTQQWLFRASYPGLRLAGQNVDECCIGVKHTMPLSVEHLIAPDAQPRLLAGDFQFTEGPAADANGDVYFVDIGRNHIHFWDAQKQELATIRENSGGADGMFVDAAGALWICEMHDKRLSKLEPGGEYLVILDSFESEPFSGPNDLTRQATSTLAPATMAGASS
jgi:hypothetical protein